MNPESRIMLPKMAFTGFAARYRQPKEEEGFEDITKVDFKVRLGSPSFLPLCPHFPICLLQHLHSACGTYTITSDVRSVEADGIFLSAVASRASLQC